MTSDEENAWSNIKIISLTVTFRLRCDVLYYNVTHRKRFMQILLHCLESGRLKWHYCRLTAEQKVALDTEGYKLHKQHSFQKTQHLKIRLQASQSQSRRETTF